MAITVTSSSPTSTAPADGATALEICEKVAPFIGLEVPDQIFGSTEREHVEMAALMDEMARRIAFDTHDWTRLRYIITLTGDGTTESATLPTDYQRMIKHAHLWQSSNPLTTLIHYPDPDEWLGLDVQALARVYGAWTVIGNQLLIKPAIPDGETVKFLYISKLYVNGDDTSKFTDDEDTFALDDRLLKLGMIWQWKAYKGLPYAEDMQTYETALAFAAANDKGTNILTVGRRRLGLDLKVAYPGVLGQ